MPRSQPAHRCRRAADSWWYQGALVMPLLTGADTGGAFSLLDMCLQRGMEPPLHTHRHEDETCYVLEGRICYQVEDATFVAGPGDVVHLPRGRQHGFRLESDYARVLLYITPAGFENFFRAQAEPAGALVVPPLPSGPPDMLRLVALSRQFGLTVG
ncbi:hypothetical protein B0919_01080 [Hymenobacter sp. CRA2]|nr:hypothetical protein B0919_01080 [Hymenobacter sp. CRA2]